MNNFSVKMQNGNKALYTPPTDFVSSGWSNVYPNNNDCNPARRLGYQMVLSEPNQNELFIFSGQGNCNGNQFETSCNLSDPWATDVGTYCWLKDLWRLNLDTYEFTNLLPVNESSVQVYGTLTYDYLDSTFYLIGGYTPPEVYDNQFSNNNTFELNVFKFKPILLLGEHAKQLYPSMLLNRILSS